MSSAYSSSSYSPNGLTDVSPCSDGRFQSRLPPRGPGRPSHKRLAAEKAERQEWTRIRKERRSSGERPVSDSSRRAESSPGVTASSSVYAPPLHHRESREVQPSSQGLALRKSHGLIPIVLVNLTRPLSAPSRPVEQQAVQRGGGEEPRSAERGNAEQRAIQRCLKTLPAAQVQDALKLMCQSEDDESAASGTTGCFDIQGALINGSPHWAAHAHARCMRCETINILLQAPADEDSVFKNTIDHALLKTRCDVQLYRTGVLPKLPTHIVDMIVAHVMRNVEACVSPSTPFDLFGRWNSDGSNNAESVVTICALLHTSRRIRASLTKHFVPRMPPCRQGSHQGLGGGAVHTQLDAFVKAAVHYYLSDFSQKSLQSIAIPACNDAILDLALAPSQCKWEVTTADEEGSPVSSRHVQIYRVGVARQSAPKYSFQGDANLTVRRACEALMEALQNALPPPRDASPYYRILLQKGAYRNPAAEVAIKLEVPDKHDDHSAFSRIWLFQESRRFTPCPGDIFTRDQGH